MEVRLKLADVVAALGDMWSLGIIGKYAVGGATAVSFYSEPIATKDLDIFFSSLRRAASAYHLSQSTVIVLKKVILMTMNL